MKTAPGKSTLVKILSGAVVPDQGAVHIQGERVPAGRPGLARQAGLSMVYQELSVCDDLSVEDNIMLGREVSTGGLLKRAQQRKVVHHALERLGHPDLQPGRLAGELSVGAKQLVEIARAIAQEAKVLILDEPTSSLPAADVEHLFAVVKRLASDGLAVIYISHFLEEVRQLCDSYFVLRDGEVAGSGDLANVTEAEIVRLMVGRSVDELYPKSRHDIGEPVLTLQNVAGTHTPKDVSFSVHRGEIFGVAGLVGAGRTETMRCIYGLDPTREGTIQLHDSNQPDNSSGEIVSPRGAIAAGLAMVSEDRKGEGLAQDMTIEDNITLSKLEPYSRFGWLHRRHRREASSHWMKRLQVKATGPDQDVSALSGGNQQKVALARVLHQDANVLILDEPHARC